MSVIILNIPFKSTITLEKLYSVLLKGVWFIGVVTHWSWRLVNNNVCQQLRLGSSCHQIYSVLLSNLNQHKQSSALVYRTQSVDSLFRLYFLSLGQTYLISFFQYFTWVSIKWDKLVGVFDPNWGVFAAAWLFWLHPLKKKKNNELKNYYWILNIHKTGENIVKMFGMPPIFYFLFIIFWIFK